MLSALAAVGAGVDPSVTPDVRPREPATSPEAPAHPGPVVTRWSRLKAYEVGFALSAFIVALLPGLVWLSTMFVPEEYRPPAMSDANSMGWWVLAVAVAGVFLLMRRQSFLAAIGGPAVGEPRPARIVDRSMRSGLRLAAVGAARGSLPMLFPWYVLVVAGIASAAGVQWPDDVFGSSWGVAWVLMPAAAVALVMRGISRLRLRLGSLMMAMIHLAGAGLAAVLFVAYPLAI
jgi:hypothetical protein